jgi:hypothetical protein
MGMPHTPERFAFVVLMLSSRDMGGRRPVRNETGLYRLFDFLGGVERVDSSRMVARHAKRANAAGDNA